MTQEEKDGQLQAHNLTQGEMKQLQRAQILGEVETMSANKGSGITDKHFRSEYESYKIPVVEKSLVHMAMEARSFNNVTGEKLSNSFVQIFDVQNFKKMIKDEAFKGYTTYILHDPTLEEEEKEKKPTTPLAPTAPLGTEGNTDDDKSGLGDDQE